MENQSPEKVKYLLILNGKSEVFAKMLSEIDKSKIVVISSKGSSDPYAHEQTIEEVLNNPNLTTEEQKTAAKTKYIKQVFKRAITGKVQDVKENVVIDNTEGVILKDEDCIPDGKLFNYQVEIINVMKVDGVTQNNGGFFSFLNKKRY